MIIKNLIQKNYSDSPYVDNIVYYSNIENELNAISTIAQNNDELANEGEDSYLTLQEVLDGNAVNLDEDTVKSLNSHIEALLNSGVENIATITLGDLAQGTISAGMF